MVTVPPDAREIHIVRLFEAPRSKVWKAFTDPKLLAQWWGRGNKLDVERYEFERGGHWRFVEHGPEGRSGFEGRFADIAPEERVAMTFEWDGMPGHVMLNTMTLEELPGGRTKLVAVALFMTEQDRDGMAASGMEQGMNQSYAALDKVLAGMEA
ncbi:MAG TPA: SRPBCC family protein [Candidatus Thermoplasmatota archaeon]|nr:SRPBCC family protein [Candidatus Thermoplasmatota archaeon]